MLLEASKQIVIRNGLQGGGLTPIINKSINNNGFGQRNDGRFGRGLHDSISPQQRGGLIGQNTNKKQSD